MLLVSKNIPLAERAKTNLGYIKPVLLCVEEKWALTKKLDDILESCEDSTEC